ncbi:hypothetical protein GWI33_000698, partial [Rhynchophorus ferrugineus]
STASLVAAAAAALTCKRVEKLRYERVTGVLVLSGSFRESGTRGPNQVDVATVLRFCWVPAAGCTGAFAMQQETLR